MGLEMLLCSVDPKLIERIHSNGIEYVLKIPDLNKEMEECLFLDKQILGFMRNENPRNDVLYKAVMGGSLFKESMDRYDCPRFMTSAEVAQLASELISIKEIEFTFHIKKVMDSWNLSDTQSSKQILNHIRNIIQYYLKASQKKKAMLFLLI
jgi:hypothetical protein